MAAAGVLMRTLQEWMDHRDLAPTQRYADYAPNEREVEMVDRAFGEGIDGLWAVLFPWLWIIGRTRRAIRSDASLAARHPASANL